jgi:hypothetical protein
MGVSRARRSWGSPYAPSLSFYLVPVTTWTSFSGAGTLAFAIRSGVNLILLLARIQRVRKMSRSVKGRPSAIRISNLNLFLFFFRIHRRKTLISIIQHALFGTDSFRFGAMLGSLAHVLGWCPGAGLH